MKIEAVVVCVDYSDYLAETIERTMRAVDSLRVVTTPTDRATLELCYKHKVFAVETNAFYEDDSKFSLARGINAGLARCDRDDWVLVVDADIALPHHTRDVLNSARLEKHKLYGIDRMMAVGRDQWNAVRGIRQFRDHCVLPPAMRMGARIALPFFGGYVPCGYFQLWHPDGSGVHDFAVSAKGTSEESDMLQSIRWSREDRVLIPEIIGIHLDVTSETGTNWAGRLTTAF